MVEVADVVVRVPLVRKLWRKKPRGGSGDTKIMKGGVRSGPSRLYPLQKLVAAVGCDNGGGRGSVQSSKTESNTLTR